MAAIPVSDTRNWLRSVAERRDRHAFEQLYGYFAPKIKGYMLRQGADDASADDLAQETMVQIWRKANHYDPQKAAVSTWVFSVARNLQIDRMRKHKFYEVALNRDASSNVENLQYNEQVEDCPDTDRLRKLIGELPEEQMEVVQLAFFEGLSHSEVSCRLSIPVGTVKSRLRLAFGKLKLGMGEQI
ncbi:MAG: sigma-70 family RNA polymerase sigma factor [Candidatus Thiodiazotropha sp. (ex. Lucinisca nassula)]|nr:sigma-70 family RNA polymerase sigma factor [Candidatus Thiodiazotropha sp. (ex. Lucinisca nassula)]